MSGSQHMDALKLANQVRLKRARDKREIASLPRPEAYGMVAAIFESPPPYWEGAAVMDLLTAPKYTGRYFALSQLRKAGVPESRRVGELTPRQRGALAGLLRGDDEQAAA